MTIRDRRPENATPEYDRYRRKSNQEWDLAGLARQDGDMEASNKHTEQAREYDRLARECLG
jgi:hypothetical protein